MAQIYVRTPFATSGDRGSIPNATPPDGSVSMTDGFGVNYQEDPDTNPDALDVPRLQFNQLMYEANLNIQQYQQHGFPEFITASDNGGVAYEYSFNDHVRYAGGWAGAEVYIYYSKVDANDSDPSDFTKWGLVQYAQTVEPGTTEIWPFSTIKTGGYVWLNGTTIGNASSNATQRANADTSAVFAKIWNDYSNTVCPIYNSNGTPGTRGANAAADFAANKAISMPQWAGSAGFFSDNMGGISARGRITTGGSGISGTTLGAQGGLETVQLTSNQNGQHAHTGNTDNAGSHFHGGSTQGSLTGTAQFNAQINRVGGVNPAYLSFVGPSLGGLGRGDGSSSEVINASITALTAAIVTSADGLHLHSFTTASSGLGSPHQNMPPAVIIGGAIMKL